MHLKTTIARAALGLALLGGSILATGTSATHAASWSGWAEVEPTGLNYITNADATTSTSPMPITFNDTLYLFRVGSDPGHAGQVLVTANSSVPVTSHGWSRWSVVPGLSTSLPVTPAVVLGVLYVFANIPGAQTVAYSNCLANCTDSASWSTPGSIALGSAWRNAPPEIRASGLGVEVLWQPSSGQSLTAADYYQIRCLCLYPPVLQQSPAQVWTISPPAGWASCSAITALDSTTFCVGGDGSLRGADLLNGLLQGLWTISGRTNYAMEPLYSGNLLYLTAVGTDNRIYLQDFDLSTMVQIPLPGGGFQDGGPLGSGWQEVDGGGTTDAAVGIASYHGQICLFAKGVLDGRVYINCQQ